VAVNFPVITYRPTELEVVQSLYGFSKSSSLDFKIFLSFSVIVFFVGDVIMRACFRYFIQVYLALGANPIRHILAQAFSGI